MDNIENGDKISETKNIVVEKVSENEIKRTTTTTLEERIPREAILAELESQNKNLIIQQNEISRLTVAIQETQAKIGQLQNELTQF